MMRKKLISLVLIGLMLSVASLYIPNLKAASQYTLTISSAHGVASPSTGTHTYDAGSSITCSVPISIAENGVTYTCTGWTGTGSVPASGSGWWTTVTIDQDSSINWNWQPVSTSGTLLNLPAPSYGLNLNLTDRARVTSLSSQTLNVSPGQSFNVNYGYQIWQGANPSEIDQLLFVCSWTPTWPPTSSYYNGIYSSIPPSYPGDSGTGTASFTAPSTPGTYYIWLCFEANYGYSQAANSFKTSLSGLPAHIKVVVSSPSETGLVGYWNFDEGSGTIVADASGNGNTGTIHDCQWVDGKVGEALEFNGVDSYVSIPNSASLDINGNGITVEYWMKLPSNWYAGVGSSNQIIFDKGDAYTAALISSSGALRFNIPYVLPYPETSKTNWSGDTWYHIANVFDGTQIRIYVNGILDKTESVVGSVSRSSINLAIGSHCYGDSNFFKGVIDEVKIYSYARTSDQVQSDYQLTANPTPTQSATSSQSPASTNQPISASNQPLNSWLIIAALAIVVIVLALVIAVRALRRRKKPETQKPKVSSPKVQEANEQVICPNCGASLPAGSSFCGKCGNTIK